MEKERAVLKVRETKKKKILAELYFVDKDKTMPFPELKLDDLSMNGTKIEVEREKGKVLSVKAGDKLIYTVSGAKPASKAPPPGRPQTAGNPQPKQKQPEQKMFSASKGDSQIKNKHLDSINYPAKAPYNFVPLNEVVIPVKDSVPDFNSYHKKRHTGWIELEIETKTPVYIRGTLTEKEDKEGKKSKDITDFYSPAGKLRIPGSSLRGMIRNIVEIVSYSKFKYSNKDRRLYYRALADKSNLRKEYSDRMSSYDRRQRRATYNVSAGVIQKRKFDYVIIPSDRYWQIKKKDARIEVDRIGENYQDFRYYKLQEGYLVVSGSMMNKKKDWMIAYPDKTNAISIPEEDVENYNDDITRGDKVPNLIKLSAKEDVPCFYVLWEDKHGKQRVAFGHTAMFRLAYPKTIGEHVIQKPDNEDIEDFAEAIFGKEEKFAGRVFFEDAFLEEGQNNVTMGIKTPKILSSPKPTTFQHYLVQSADDIRSLNSYNSNALIRGYKLYWHKSGNNWEQKNLEEIKKHKTQYTEINPVKPQTKFKGKIRFENLSSEELGALLFSIDLPGNCCHKIGMGKPLGLGSVKIRPVLYLSNREKRYRSFFAEWEIQTSSDFSEFKKSFEEYICSSLGENKNSLWDIDRLKELRIILDFNIGSKLEQHKKSEYMELGSFKHRNILPKPSKISL